VTYETLVFKMAVEKSKRVKPQSRICGVEEMNIQCNEAKTEIHLLDIKDKNLYAALLEEINATIDSWRRINGNDL
jgi:hypothetical protein